MKKKPAKPEPGAIRSATELASLLKADKKLAGSNLIDDFDSVRTIRTGIDTLDGICGRGVPRSRSFVYSGEEGSGKTTAALCTAASFQRRGGIVMFIDAERKLDLDWARRNGVDTDAMIIAQPIHLERAFRLADAAARASDPTVPFLIVLDSANAAPTKAQKEADYEDDLMAPQARVFSKSFPKFVDVIESSGASFLLISQIRSKMNLTTTIAGGNAVRFYSILIVTFRATGKITASGKKLWEIRKEFKGKAPRDVAEVIGVDIGIQTIKNQIAPPFQESKMRIVFDRGIDRVWCTLQRAQETKVVKVKSSWSSFGGLKWQSQRSFERLMKKRPKLLSAIRKAIRKA
jgi:recombination protein RecA